MGKTKDIREAVEAELSYDPLIDSANISVKNIDGDVALNGTVPSYPQYLEAFAAAQRVAGVKNVHNHLAVVLPDDNYRDDPMLTTAANNALALNVTVPDGVEATAYDGNVTLTGTVTYGRERGAAVATVAGLTGVRNVIDEIEISYDADPLDVTVLVQDALDRNALISDDSDVVVDTADNTVTLTGHVRTWAEHDAAVGAAWMAGGVFQVRADRAGARDQLRVRGRGPAVRPALTRSHVRCLRLPAGLRPAGCRVRGGEHRQRHPAHPRRARRGRGDAGGYQRRLRLAAGHRGAGRARLPGGQLLAASDPRRGGVPAAPAEAGGEQFIRTGGFHALAPARGGAARGAGRGG